MTNTKSVLYYNCKEKRGNQNEKDFNEADTSQVEVLESHPKLFAYVVKVPNEKIDGMFRELHKHKVTLIKEVQYSLEKYFMEYVIKGE